ncbi:MAG: SIS domain-containing protein [Acidimicrobiales bacterium]
MTSREGNSPAWADFFAKDPSLEASRIEIVNAVELLDGVLRNGGRVLLCGNGGSAADCEHIAGELAKACALARPLPLGDREALFAAGDDGELAEGLQQGLDVLPLVSQAALLTAIVNDQSGDLIFAQQVVAYGRPGGVLWALTTSGASANVVLALRTARARGLHTISFTGPTGGAVESVSDVTVRLPGANVQEIQSSHQRVYHEICLDIERRWYGL